MRNLKTAQQIHKDHVNAVIDVDYSPTGKEFVAGSYDKTVRIFKCGEGRSREVYHTRRMQRLTSVLWSLDNKYVLCGSDEMDIRIWKANRSEKLGAVS
jgi:WD repeat and SOF domain-containing protein 1